MNAVQAGRILERLAGHWRGIAANDAAADDWIEAIINTSDAVAEETAAVLVKGWTKDRTPRVSDWLETCALVAPRVTKPMHALPSASPPGVSEEVWAAKVEEARAALANAERPVPTPVMQHVEIVRHERPRVFWGERRMTPEERDEELRAIGDRRVRERT